MSALEVMQAEYENGPGPAMWEALRSQGSRGVEFADLLRFRSAGFEVSIERHRVLLEGGPMGLVWRWREHSGEDLIGKQNRIDRKASR
jgi:hypothetical protein